MISARQVKAARALLGWSEGDLAARAGIDEAEIAAIEAADKPLIAPAHLAATLVRTFAAAGLDFLGDHGETGVRLRRRKLADGLRPSELNSANDG
ncbi:transcriptional regulator [Faunimonas sp. B44]|uniref:transcriptional regulator n=1 Tax=Faunimonas sp. B44 TaxID=3461493 RepID=UPI004044EA26